MTKSTSRQSQCMGCQQLLTAKQMKKHQCSFSGAPKSKNKYADAPRTVTVGTFGSALADALEKRR